MIGLGSVKPRSKTLSAIAGLTLAAIVSTITLVGCGSSHPTPSPITASSTTTVTAPAGASLVSGGQIVVFASSSLEKPFQEIGKLCAEEQGVQVSFQFASSSVLDQQIQAGDRVDVFACAGVSDLGP